MPSVTPPKLILIVEDDEAARGAMALVLRNEGYQVAQAGDGGEALRLLRAGPRPDLVLLDMLMPVMDGWEFLWLQAREGQPPVPVILMTGTDVTREWARDNGCQGLLHKPAGAEALLEEVRRCLGEAASRGPQ